eukprot:974418-Pleurochrysis_carterae.AAC.2
MLAQRCTISHAISHAQTRQTLITSCARGRGSFLHRAGATDTTSLDGVDTALSIPVGREATCGRSPSYSPYLPPDITTSTGHCGRHAGVITHAATEHRHHTHTGRLM